MKFFRRKVFGVPNIIENLTEEEKNIFITSLMYAMELSHNKRMDYLKSRIKEFGISESALKKIKPVTDPAELSKMIKQIKSIKQRRYILRELILVAVATHELSDEELAGSYNIGTRIGIKEEKVSDFFMWAAKGLEWEIEGLQLIEGDL